MLKIKEFLLSFKAKCGLKGVKSPRNGGFVLLELLIALAIVLLVVGGSFEFYRSYLKSERLARNTLEAISIARNLSARMGYDIVLRDEKQVGQKGRFNWAYKLAALPVSDKQELVPYSLTITVSWGQKQGHDFTLHTIKLREQ